MKTAYYLRSLITLCLLGSLLAGCSMQGLQYGQQNHVPQLTGPEYLQLAKVSTGRDRQINYLKAADRFVANKNTYQARLAIAAIPTSTLPIKLAFERQLIFANILILEQNYVQATNIIDSLSNYTTQMTNQERIKLETLRANIQAKSGNLLASIQTLDQVTSLESGNQRQQTLQKIWMSLNQVPAATLQQLQTQATTPTLQGWLALALINKNYISDPNKLVTQLATWKQQYPGHPAANLIASNLARATVTKQQPTSIALLLPESGPYAASAKAIRNGFFAAYYDRKNTLSKPVSIKVYDTSKTNVSSVYQQATQEGADFVVGPLTKQNVAALASSTRLSVPTLALNTLPGDKTYPNLYQFGLSPADEAQQVANKAFADNHRRAIIIAPNNTWGQTIANNFKNQWQALGGQVVAQHNFTNQASLNTDISNLLGVAQSQQRYQQLRKTLRTRMRFLPRRRKDFDMIFLVAQPVYARQIKPLLRYYFAGHIPVYATSQIYTGSRDSKRDHDLNGIIFCDMPWVITPGHMYPQYLDSMQNHITSIWGRSYHRYPKLYALGVDSFDIISNLNKMSLLPALGINSATGVLSLNAQGKLCRQLTWSQIQDGVARPLHD